MSDIKLKVTPLFPVNTETSNGVTLEKNAGKWQFSLDYNAFDLRAPFVPSDQYQLALFDSVGGQYFRVGSTQVSVKIVTTPSLLSVFDNATVGTVVGTLSVIGGTGSYTYSLTLNPGGKYSISGNQLKVAAPLTAGTDTITIQADNGAGSIVTLTTTVTVLHGGYVATYFIYGF